MKHLCAALLLAAWPAVAAPVNALVTTGGVTYALNSSTPGTVINDWSAVSANAGGGFAISSPGSGSIWLTGNPYGLTNTVFTCTDVNGCLAFQFIYTLLGVTIAEIASIEVLIDGTVSAPTNISTLVGCTSTATCAYNTVSGSATVSGTFGSTSVLKAFLLLPPGPPPPGQANLQFYLTFTPSGGGVFANGATVELPNSLHIVLVPEPSTWGFAALALGVLAVRKGGASRRRRVGAALLLRTI